MLGAPIPPLVVAPLEHSSGSPAVGLLALIVVVALTVRWIIRLRAQDDLPEPQPNIEREYRAA